MGKPGIAKRVKLDRVMQTTKKLLMQIEKPHSSFLF